MQAQQKLMQAPAHAQAFLAYFAPLLPLLKNQTLAYFQTVISPLVLES